MPHEREQREHFDAGREVQGTTDKPFDEIIGMKIEDRSTIFPRLK